MKLFELKATILYFDYTVIVWFKKLQKYVIVQNKLYDLEKKYVCHYQQQLKQQHILMS